MNVWYFAYGSNVKLAQMKERVGEFKLSRRAVLRNYKLVFNISSKRWQGFTANIQETGHYEDKVLGVVYHISDIQLAKLQTFEGVPPVEISVELEDESEIKNVKTFLWNTTEQEHKPPEVYRRIIEQGLTEHGYENATVRKNFDKFRR
jgi:cation transport regulator ChaC